MVIDKIEEKMAAEQDVEINQVETQVYKNNQYAEKNKSYQTNNSNRGFVSNSYNYRGNTRGNYRGNSRGNYRGNYQNNNSRGKLH